MFGKAMCAICLMSLLLWFMASAYDREYLVPGGWFSTARCGAGRIPFSIPPTFQSLCRESATDVGLVSVHLGQGWEKGRL